MTVRIELLKVLDVEHADAVIDHRRVTVKKPLTVRAAMLLCRRFLEWGDPNQAADIMIERCWQGFDPTWVKQRGRTSYVDAARERFHHDQSASVCGDNRDAQCVVPFVGRYR